ARAALAWADAQLRRAMSEAGDGDITAAGRISALEGQRWHARLQLNAAEEAHEAAIAALDLSRGTHTELSQSAARLRWCACEAIRDTALGDLRDPSGLMKVVGDVAGVVYDWTIG